MEAMCVHFFNFDNLRIKLQSSDFFRGTKFRALLFLSLHSSSSTSCSYPWLPMVVSFFQTHLLLEVASRFIFLLLHSTTIRPQEAKESIDEEDPRPTSSTWSYIRTVSSLTCVDNVDFALEMASPGCGIVVTIRRHHPHLCFPINRFLLSELIGILWFLIWLSSVV